MLGLDLADSLLGIILKFNALLRVSLVELLDFCLLKFLKVFQILFVFLFLFEEPHIAVGFLVLQLLNFILEAFHLRDELLVCLDVSVRLLQHAFARLDEMLVESIPLLLALPHRLDVQIFVIPLILQ